MVALIVSLFGQVGIGSLEIMAMKVEGVSYFKDKWNYLDVFSTLLYFFYFALRMLDNKDLVNLD